MISKASACNFTEFLKFGLAGAGGLSLSALLQLRAAADGRTSHENQIRWYIQSADTSGPIRVHSPTFDAPSYLVTSCSQSSVVMSCVAG